MGRSGDREPTGSADFRITSARQHIVWKRHQDNWRERRLPELTKERPCSEERQLPPQLTERDVPPRYVRTPPPPSSISDETIHVYKRER